MANMLNAIREGQKRSAKGLTSNGPGLTGKNASKEMPPKKFARQEGGAFWKKPKDTRALGNHKDMSSGETGPIKRVDDNKKRYAGTPQPEQYSNSCGPQKTKFIT